MSVAEKLEALEKGVTAGEWKANVAWFRPSLTVGGRYKFTGRMYSEADAQFCAAMANALPEIIAVVKAAERIERLPLGGFYANPVQDAVDIVRPALSALDEALPQIGSATEPEDPTPQ